MSMLVVSKYAALPDIGSNPRWYELALILESSGTEVTVLTSDSNHISLMPPLSVSVQDISIGGICYKVIRTAKYRHTASIARVISWFDFDFKLFHNFRHMTPDVVVISSLSLTSIIFGIYLKWRHGSRLVFEIRDIWPLTMIEEGGFSRWHPLALYLRLYD